MENGIDGSPDRSSSPTPFLGFSSSAVKMKEVSKVAECPAPRVSQPRTTKSRASLVWQKNTTVKEETEDETDVKEKMNSPPMKQKSTKSVKLPKIPKVEKPDEGNTTEEDTALNSGEASTSAGNEQNLMMLVRRRRRKNKSMNAKGFKCNQCGRVYKYLRGMRQHQRLECNVEPQFPCPYCPNKFRYRQGIREHVRTQHEQAFPKWYATHYVIPMLKQEQERSSLQLSSFTDE